MTDGQTLTIRRFTPSDQAVTRHLILAGLADHFGTLNEQMNLDLDDIAGTYVNDDSLFVVAQRNGEIVGCGGLVMELPGIGRIVRLSVSREQRGQGIGRALVQHLLTAAQARGDGRVVVEINDDWHDAIGLYLACGFNHVDHRNGELYFALDLSSAVR